MPRIADTPHNSANSGQRGPDNKCDRNYFINIDAHNARDLIVFGNCTHSHTCFSMIDDVQQHNKADYCNNGNDQTDRLDLNPADRNILR